MYFIEGHSAKPDQVELVVRSGEVHPDATFPDDRPLVAAAPELVAGVVIVPRSSE